MKINIGINTYKNFENFNNREKMCFDSLLRIKNKFPDNINLYNFTFNDENYNLKEFINLNSLKESFISNKKKLPYVNEILDNLSQTNCDYFLFINNDVAISDRFIKNILSHKDKDCFPASKLHFTKLDSIDDPSPIPESVSVHGFEGFALKKDWWLKNKNYFLKMVLGCAYWDTYFFTKCMLYGNCKVLNKPPLSIFHLDHKSDSMEQSPGNKHNENNFVSDPDQLATKWFGYVHSVLLKRPTHHNILWYIPFSNEEELEKNYFKI